MVVVPKSGQGDIVARIGGQPLLAECKGGVINSRHAGQLSKLRRGLCEAVGLLMTKPVDGGRHIAVAPSSPATRDLARRMAARASAAGIEIALVDAHGTIVFVRPSQEAE